MPEVPCIAAVNRPCVRCRMTGKDNSNGRIDHERLQSVINVVRTGHVEVTMGDIVTFKDGNDTSFEEGRDCVGEFLKTPLTLL